MHATTHNENVCLLPIMPIGCTAATFEPHEGAIRIEQNGRRIIGLIGGEHITATTNLVLGDERVAIEFLVATRFISQRAYQTSYGVVSPDADTDKILGTQVGSVALNAAGALVADYEMKRVNLGRILPGATVRLEWEPAICVLVWRVNDATVCRWSADLRGWTFAVGSIGPNEVIEIGQPGRHIPPMRSSLAEAIAAADE